MHEENFLGWLREDWKSETKEDKEVREDEDRKEKRGTDKEEHLNGCQEEMCEPRLGGGNGHFSSQGENFGV